MTSGTLLPLVDLSVLPAKQTPPAWRTRRKMSSWVRGRRFGWRRHTPRRNRYFTLSGWGYKHELCHHWGLRVLLCKRLLCSPVFLSGGNKMLSLHPLYLDRSTDKTLWLTRHGKPALEIQSLAGWGGNSNRSYERKRSRQKWNHQILSINQTQSGGR